MRSFRKLLSISLSLVGAMVGVGLASGREVVSFFARYGMMSILLCALSAFVVFVLVFVSFLLLFKNRHKNKKRKNEENSMKYHERLFNCCEKFRMNTVFDIVLFVCQLSICSVMFAGMFSLFSEISQLFVVRLFLLVLVFLVSFLVLKKNNELMFSFNFFLSLLLVVFCFALLLIFVFSRDVNRLVGVSFSRFGFASSVLYAGMNVLTIFPLLREQVINLKNKKEIFVLSFLVGFSIFLILMLVLLVILFYGGDMIGSDMIMLSLSGSVSSVLFFVHFFLILFSIFTTLLSTASGACVFLKKFDRKSSVFVVLLFCFLLSFVGFSSLVDFLYPVLGFVFVVCEVLFVFGDMKTFFIFKKKKRKSASFMCEKRP